MEKKRCLHCHSPIYEGRVDKIFCNDICRSRYHNNHNSDSDWIIHRMNLQSQLNNDIMDKFYPQSLGRKGIPLQKLILEGFNHKVHFGIPIKINGTRRPTTFYTYKYRYEYNPDNEEIIIYKASWQLYLNLNKK